MAKVAFVKRGATKKGPAKKKRAAEEKRSVAL
jgi:hypothetical protein